MLAGTIDLTPGESKAATIENIEHTYDAPLMPSQQILLGLKTKKA